MEGTVLIKRVCGHSTPYTFKKNERYGKQRFEKFLSTKCPACTLAAIQALEAQQKAASQKLKEQRREAAKAAKSSS